MRAPDVVVLAPTLDDGLRFGEAVEDLAVQKLVAELRVEALAIAVLPRRARLDEGRLRSDDRDPVRTALATNSGPLSECTCPGTSRRMKWSERTLMTSVDLSLRSIRHRPARRNRRTALQQPRRTSELPSSLPFSEGSAAWPVHFGASRYRRFCKLGGEIGQSRLECGASLHGHSGRAGRQHPSGLSARDHSGSFLGTRRSRNDRIGSKTMDDRTSHAN